MNPNMGFIYRRRVRAELPIMLKRRGTTIRREGEVQGSAPAGRLALRRRQQLLASPF